MHTKILQKYRQIYDNFKKNSFNAPASVALSTNREVAAVVGIVVAAVIGSEAPADVLARRTTHR